MSDRRTAVSMANFDCPMDELLVALRGGHAEAFGNLTFSYLNTYVIRLDQWPSDRIYLASGEDFLDPEDIPQGFFRQWALEAESEKGESSPISPAPADEAAASGFQERASFAVRGKYYTLVRQNGKIKLFFDSGIIDTRVAHAIDPGFWTNAHVLESAAAAFSDDLIGSVRQLASKISILPPQSAAPELTTEIRVRAAGDGRPRVYDWDKMFAHWTLYCVDRGIPDDPADMRAWIEAYFEKIDQQPDVSAVNKKVSLFYKARNAKLRNEDAPKKRDVSKT